MTFKTKSVLAALNLQLFADGGGASAGAPAAGNAAVATTGGDNSLTASNPIEDKAAAEPKVIYGKQNTQTSETNSRKTFEELVKSDDYKDEAQAYLDKTFSRRMKSKDSTIESLTSENAKMRRILEMNNARYGLNPDSDTYLDDYAAKVMSDTKLYEEEALEAGMNVEDYIKLKQAEQIIAQDKRNAAARENELLIINHVQRVANEAKELMTEFPNFNIEAELKNDKFKKLVDPPELGGSGISVRDAFYAVHHNEIMKSYAQTAANQAMTQVANAVKKNKERPVENGLSHSTPTVVKDDPSQLKLEDFKRIRENYRRTGERVKF